MARILRDFVAHLLGTDTAAPVEHGDHLVAIAPARPVRRGIPDEYLERHPEAGTLTAGRKPATRTSRAIAAPRPQNPVREPFPPLPCPTVPAPHARLTDTAA